MMGDIKLNNTDRDCNYFLAQLCSTYLTVKSKDEAAIF